MKKTDPRVVVLKELAELIPQICPDEKTTADFSRGLLLILQKTSGSLFGDIWECVEFYNGSRKKFEEKAVPFLTEIQMMVYLADIVVEDLDDNRRARQLLKMIFEVVYKRIGEFGIKDKAAISLMKECYQFLLLDRQVRDEKILFQREKIIETLNFKVSDLVALMKMAAELSGCKKIPASEWQIWRELELMREFIDDHEDRDEDIKENAEQFNSIVQLKRQGVEVKKVIKNEGQKLKSLISKIEDIDKRKKLEKIADILINQRLPQNFKF